MNKKWGVGYNFLTHPTQRIQIPISNNYSGWVIAVIRIMPKLAVRKPGNGIDYKAVLWLVAHVWAPEVREEYPLATRRTWQCHVQRPWYSQSRQEH